jgi:ABC-type sugar transport systems, permease components
MVASIKKNETASKSPSKDKIAWLFLAPHLTIFVIFFLIPVIFGIYISFTNWDLINSPTFIGFDNYKELFFESNSTFYEQLRIGLKNTLIFVILSVPFCLAVPLLLATALNAKPRLGKVFQSVFYMPSLFAISAVTIIWRLVFHVNYGPVNVITKSSTSWLGNQPYAWVVLVVVTVWWTIGGNMVIYQAALNGVPQDIYEAADIDGANAVQKFFKIALPQIRGQILYTAVMTTIAQFNVYGQPLILTGGGPNNSTRVLLMYIQQNAFGSGQSIAGIASAMAVILGLCIMAVSVVQFKLLKVKN